MKKGWVVKPLGELCSIKNGKSNSEDAIDDAPYAFFDRSKKIKRSTKYLFDCDALIIPGEGAEFLPRQYSGKFDLHQRAYALYDFKNEIDLKYLYYFLIHEKDYFPRVAVGATVKSLRLRHFEDLPVLHPPLPEQQRIVGKLDAAFATLAEAQAHVERNRANARELFESFLNGVFEGKGEWTTRPLHEFIHVKHGFAFLGEHFTSAGKHVLLTMGNFFEKGGYRDRGEKQKFYTGPVPDDFVLSKGDLVVAMTEQAAGLLGAPLLVPESGKFLHNQRIGLVQQPNGPVVLNEFLFHIFNTNTFRDAVHASGSGVKVRHTSPTKIGDVEVSYPASLKEQQRIVDRLADLEQETRQLETTYQQKLSELAGLKKAVLGAAFRGEL
jgi:type I restriction enzyme S subunit